MVTPTNGALTLKGRSGKTYAINFYISDVIGAYVTMSLVGVAGSGSQNWYSAPEDCIITDISLATGPTVMTNMRLQISDIDVGVIVPIANYLNTLANRGNPNIPLPANKKFTILQA